MESKAEDLASRIVETVGKDLPNRWKSQFTREVSGMLKELGIDG